MSSSPLCFRCAADPHPRLFHDPRKCAFPEGVFVADNWQCASMAIARNADAGAIVWAWGRGMSADSFTALIDAAPVGSSRMSDLPKLRLCDDVLKPDAHHCSHPWCDSYRVAASSPVSGPASDAATIAALRRELRIAHDERRELIWQRDIAREDRDAKFAVIDTLRDILGGVGTDDIIASARQLRSEADHRGRLCGRLLDELAGRDRWVVARLIGEDLFAEAMKAAGREVKP